MAATKHFKFINSKTGNTIFYYSYTAGGDAQHLKAELEKIKEQVAIQNGVFTGTIYWEEVVEKDNHI
ncbi:hypothetical protein [Mucilaginibacter ginkgonis]|uniref:Uncharacterized protein n=1 Tax=Mucilaginibacter ginkgonis TaxID=2682091 RepID=A0A6I4HZA3_9SPHI|nr:hypothetical protein [Mucilaginibacter ginkgonis]QQL48679.1 hypothetical protein GO620_010860 [Mucilaginibacter ginkgonis]